MARMNELSQPNYLLIDDAFCCRDGIRQVQAVWHRSAFSKWWQLKFWNAANINAGCLCFLNDTHGSSNARIVQQH